MPTVESLKPLPVWLNPGHLLSTARILMHGHGVKALGVLDGDRLVGMLTSESVAGKPDESTVREAMEPADAVVNADTPVRLVAEQFVERDLERAPILKGGRYLGVVTASMLLRELRRSWDPLTGLSWSDALREWGMDSLREGKEIVVLFIDLNDFGAYNKRYGHVVGDRVLQRIAEILKEMVDPAKDVLVRYGGDEFAIAMQGVREDGRAFADAIRRRMSDVRVPEAEEPVGFCIGVAGGKRTRERENVHYAATLDNLINLASQECIAQKRPKQVVKIEESAPKTKGKAEKKPPAEPRSIRVMSVIADEASATSLTQVVLSYEDAVVSGVDARMGRSVIHSVASATAKALQRAAPNIEFRLEGVNLTEGIGGERLVTVTGVVRRNGTDEPVGGARVVSGDLYAVVAEATIEAFVSARV